jgi:hypothetical protein
MVLIYMYTYYGIWHTFNAQNVVSLKFACNKNLYCIIRISMDSQRN